MSVEKAKLKVLVADEIGGGLKEALARAEQRAVEARGGARALAAVKDELKAAAQEVAAEWKDGKVKLDGEDPSAVPKYVVDKLMLVMRRVHERAESAAQAALVTEGEVVGLRAAVKQLVDMRAREMAKAVAPAEPPAPGGNGGPRPPGAHPGPSLKAQRQAEEAASKPTRRPADKARRGAKKAPRAAHS